MSMRGHYRNVDDPAASVVDHLIDALEAAIQSSPVGRRDNLAQVMKAYHRGDDRVASRLLLPHLIAAIDRGCLRQEMIGLDVWYDAEPAGRA